jgi:hypothetical protein
MVKILFDRLSLWLLIGGCDSFIGRHSRSVDPRDKSHLLEIRSLLTAIKHFPRTDHGMLRGEHWVTKEPNLSGGTRIRPRRTFKQLKPNLSGGTRIRPRRTFKQLRYFLRAIQLQDMAAEHQALGRENQNPDIQGP